MAQSPPLHYSAVCLGLTWDEKSHAELLMHTEHGKPVGMVRKGGTASWEGLQPPLEWLQNPHAQCSPELYSQSLLLGSGPVHGGFAPSAWVVLMYTKVGATRDSELGQLAVAPGVRSDVKTLGKPRTHLDAF